MPAKTKVNKDASCDQNESVAATENAPEINIKAQPVQKTTKATF